MAVDRDGKRVGPILVLVGVVCERCGYRFKAPKGCAWPVGCPKCTADAAPSWWFRENNRIK